MIDKIYFSKFKETAIIPTKREEDAGFDIYACFDEPYMLIKAHQTINISTGIITAFPANVVAILKERGSTGSKGIGQRCGVIDSGYRGEWFVTLTNHNDKDIIILKNDSTEVPTNLKDIIIYPYEKAIAQALFISLAKFESTEVFPEKILNMTSERGAGKVGSSGK